MLVLHRVSDACSAIPAIELAMLVLRWPYIELAMLVLRYIELAMLVLRLGHRVSDACSACNLGSWLTMQSKRES